MGKVVGLILAGGRSSRFGSDKALARLGGRPLLQVVAQRLESQVDRLVVSGESNSCLSIDAAYLSDPIPDRGPLGGILAGLDWLYQNDIDRLVSVSVDTPFFPEDLVARLVQASNADEAVICRQGGQLHPSVGLWPVALRPFLRQAIARQAMSMTRFAQVTAGARICDFDDAAAHAFLNINTRDDLALAERIYAAEARP
ncbi:molybdenum cofactor guanylyltransferase [Nitratireductor basaltis]|uniref:Molybdenum cofactor guanylyltransferase n=1 Tax=Nitratireductor basaltis TaxID=472175 RepID=A0A084UAX6_9HYPH|nr:molybdenum cofactor guanylyltransferase [Nitratireductor basaltis]KFB10112.1 Molybdenum cofactor guanylyltransferase [Nitratireductor basaltis]